MNKTLSLLIFVMLIASIKSVAQTKHYASSSHTITKANGNFCNVKKTKNIFIKIYIDNYMPKPNDKGTITMQNISFNSKDYSNRTYFETFRIYSIDLEDDGIYKYWTIDIAQDGQTVLFKVDLNSATAKVTMMRYAPGKSNDVLKTIVYELD